MRKTFMAKSCDIKRDLYLVDAKGEVLGRLAASVARILRGKHKPIFTPHADCGDRVVVINTKDIRVTGKKAKDKIYCRYSGYPGGLREMSFEEMLIKNPTQIIKLAVKRMLPINALGRDMFKKLRVYKDDKTPQFSQKMIKLSV